MTSAPPQAPTHPRRALPILTSAPNTDLADGQQKISAHEDAAHEKRNWVRLSYDCNNHCTFCLDSNAHDGTMRDDREIRVQIVEGRKKGSTRLILSGGEPTMHPLFLEYVKLGKMAGYPKVQTVTNGRMFAYPDFLARALENGLNEITFSLHGHTAKLHDALVGTPGAFVEEVAGLKAALAAERFIVNVDIVINKQNVKHLPVMLETFMEWGVREFDLLHIIPFGNAWTDARDHLFYDLDDPEILVALRKAMELSRRPDVHIWLNRFPPPYTEGYEELIQDPYKLNDEVRGRREEYDRYLSIGQKLMCREPDRCKRCYLEPLCDTLDEVLAVRKLAEVDVVRLDGAAPLAGTLPPAKRAEIVAKDLSAARSLASATSARELSLELTSYAGLESALEGEMLWGKRLARVVAKDAATLAALAGLPTSIAIVVELNAATAPALLAMGEIPARFVLLQPTHGRVTDARANDVELRAFFAAAKGDYSVEGAAPCLSGRAPSEAPSRLDGAMLGVDGRVDMTKYANRFVEAGFFSKSIRCSDCVYDGACKGMHVNWIRAHGYAELHPIAKSGLTRTGANAIRFNTTASDGADERTAKTPRTARNAEKPVPLTWRSWRRGGWLGSGCGPICPSGRRLDRALTQ